MSFGNSSSIVPISFCSERASERVCVCVCVCTRAHMRAGGAELRGEDA